VPTRPCPLFGRPVHRRDGSHRLRPGASPHALRIPPRGGHPALLGVARRGRRDTLAFGYGALHPSASGTSTRLNTSLPSAHCGPIRHPLAVRPLPRVPGYSLDMAPPLSRWGEEGFSSRSTCPGHRAVAITPPECPAASASCAEPCCLRLSTVRLGLRGLSISGPPVRSLPLRPGDSLTILSMAWSVGFRVSVSLHPATRVTGLWLLPRRV
jgi:hypothetical protein